MVLPEFQRQRVAANGCPREDARCTGFQAGTGACQTISPGDSPSTVCFLTARRRYTLRRHEEIARLLALRRRRQTGTAAYLAAGTLPYLPGRSARLSPVPSLHPADDRLLRPRSRGTAPRAGARQFLPVFQAAERCLRARGRGYRPARARRAGGIVRQEPTTAIHPGPPVAGGRPGTGGARSPVWRRVNGRRPGSPGSLVCIPHRDPGRKPVAPGGSIRCFAPRVNDWLACGA